MPCIRVPERLGSAIVCIGVCKGGSVALAVCSVNAHLSISLHVFGFTFFRTHELWSKLVIKPVAL